MTIPDLSRILAALTIWGNTMLNAADSIARLREQVIQQQARIEELNSHIEFVHAYPRRFIPHPKATDDTAALKAHDDALWNEAVEKCANTVFENWHMDSVTMREILRELKR